VTVSNGPDQDLHGLSVLAAFAHPDDEGFGCGGTLAMLVARGAQITLVCATNGDVGEISDPALATPENLAQVRREELRRAMAVTGVQDVRFLGYRDSGMAGTEDNNHPDSLSRAEPEMVAGELADIIREVRPELVITHDPTGGYGHPDHTAVYRHATRAFTLAGDSGHEGHSAHAQQPWSPRLLYYVCFPRSNFRRMWQQMLDAGITPPFASMDIESIGSPDEDVTTVVNAGAFVDTKVASLYCHRTQIDPNGPFAQLPQEITREMMSTEYFTLAAHRDGGQGADLLAGL
jgi:LmbE family N-acetylglucosaminyl deacetylase